MASAAPQPDPLTAYAVDFATLAREIAQDIFTVDQIVGLHRLSDEEWQQISRHPRFVAMLTDMQREWNSAANTKERVKIKAATGLETTLETFIAEINDPNIPLTQKVDAGKFLARLGELDGSTAGSSLAGGGGVVINIVTSSDRQPITIEAVVAPRIEHQAHQGAISDG